MALKGKPLLLTTSDQDVYVCPSTQEASVHALVFSNLTSGAITISIKRYIQSTGTTQQLVAALSVAANSTFNWPKPMNMAVGDKIIASASANSSIVCDYGAYENSATPAAVGFTGRGAWSSGSTYAVNDVVTVSGTSYLAIQASTNQNPTTATSFWMVLASKGDTGTGDVTGPASSTNNNVAVFDGITGKLLKQGTAGTDFVAPGTATTFTATQTFTGSSSALGIVLNDAAETTTISATAATGTINYDVTTQSVLYYTNNASANWTVNFRASSGTSMNTAMAIGQSVTVTFLVTQGSTAFFNNAVQVDGSSVTPKYQGGTAWSAGNASSIDAYTYTIVKTGNAAFTVFAAQTRFA